MSYTGRSKYKSRRERMANWRRNSRATLIIGGLIILVILIMKRAEVWQYLKSFSY